MDTANDGWAFLIPFILFAVIVLIAMVVWTPSGGEPKEPSPDPLYDWAEEGDFDHTEVDETYYLKCPYCPVNVGHSDITQVQDVLERHIEVHHE